MNETISNPGSQEVAAGFGLPNRFTTVDAEYEALTAGIGFLSLGNLVFIRVCGRDATGFLQGMVTENIHALAKGGHAESWVLEASGKIITALSIYALAGGEYLLCLPSGKGSVIRQHLDRYVIMEDVRFEVPDLTCLSVQGPRTTADLLSTINDDETLWFTHDRCGSGGYDLICTRESREAILSALRTAGFPQIGHEALNIARVEAFIPWFGTDMHEGVNPMVYGPDRISANKGCYIGQETVAMTRDRGKPPKITVLLSCEARAPLRPGITLYSEGKIVGSISSLVFSPKNETHLAIATVKYKPIASGDELSDDQNRLWKVKRTSDSKAK